MTMGRREFILGTGASIITGPAIAGLFASPGSEASRLGLAATTDGEIAVLNLESARQAAWTRFEQTPEVPGIAEAIVEQEQLSAQFLGDMGAYDRLQTLGGQLALSDAGSPRTLRIRAQIASATHRFAEARALLAEAGTTEARDSDSGRLLLCIDQAQGARLDAVLEKRRWIAERSGRLEDLVPLGAALADLGDFDEAERAYEKALASYRDASPFAVAWVCFQVGVMWGEQVPEPQLRRAARWYSQAIETLPSYVKARVHLAELRAGEGQFPAAEALLLRALSRSDPEVRWRLADVMAATGRRAEAHMQLQAAQAGFEGLLESHLLAFADHGAQFYLGSGADPARAFDLARANLANRPTLRAFELAYSTAIGAGAPEAAAELLTVARARWGHRATFR